ncbi:MAG: methionyl-tRNA formyltransferase [Anaplasma sp.]
MKVLFMGSSEFSVPALESLLHSSHHEVVAVYTKAPKPAGRGHSLTKTPVHVYADKFGTPVRSPTSLRSESEKEVMAKYAPDVVVVVSYGLILPQWVLMTPGFGCVNVHPSLLPRWRGAAPMQHAILSGDELTGVTIMQLGEELDAGDIFLQESTPIGKQENIRELGSRLSIMGSQMLLEVLDNLGSIRSTKQSDFGVTYAKKPEEFQIDFNNPADYICRQIRALYPRVFFLLGGRRIRVLGADSYALPEMQVGDVVNDRLHIKCGSGTALVPQVVQPESRKPCSIDSFLCGLRGDIPQNVL